MRIVKERRRLSLGAEDDLWQTRPYFGCAMCGDECDKDVPLVFLFVPLGNTTAYCRRCYEGEPMKREQLQWLIDRRDYRTLYREATHVKDDGIAARLRLVCAATDVDYIHGRSPSADNPPEVVAAIRAAKNLLDMPNLAAWVLNEPVPAPPAVARSLDYEALFQKALPIFQRQAGTRVRGVALFEEVGLPAEDAKSLLSWLSSRPDKGVLVEAEVVDYGQPTGKFFALWDLFKSSPRACGFDTDSWRAGRFSFVLCFQSNATGENT